MHTHTIGFGTWPMLGAAAVRAVGDALDAGNTLLAEVARDLGCTPAKAVLAWHRALGIVPLPRSTDPKRQRENLDSQRFTLSAEQLQALNDRDGAGAGSQLDPLTYEQIW